jgi:hypothetical protein
VLRLQPQRNALTTFPPQRTFKELTEWIEVGEGVSAKEVKKVKRKGMDPERTRVERERLEAEQRAALATQLRWRLRDFRYMED